MAHYNGSIDISFYSLHDYWNDFEEYIKNKYKECGKTFGWEFLTYYDANNHALNGINCINYDTEDNLFEFLTEIVKKFERITFYGNFDCENSGVRTTINFSHYAYSNRLWWISEYDDSDYVDVKRFIWNAETNKKKRLRKNVISLEKPKDPAKGLSLKDIIDIEGTAYENRISRIEHIHEGDTLILKADYDSKYYTPVGIEVFNDKNETLGYLRNSNPDKLVQLAYYIDVLDVYVASVTPLSKRRKNSKYALLDVGFNVKASANLSAEQLEKAEEFIAQSNIIEQKENDEKLAYEEFMMELYHKRVAIGEGELYSLRKLQIPNLAVGKVFPITISPKYLAAVMNGENIIGYIGRVGNYSRGVLSTYNVFSNDQFSVYAENIIRFHYEKLECMITKIEPPQKRDSDTIVKVRIQWKSQD